MVSFCFHPRAFLSFFRIILLTFKIENLEDSPVEGAEIDLEDQEIVTTDSAGEAEYTDRYEDTYSYKVTTNGFEYWDEVYVDNSTTETVTISGEPFEEIERDFDEGWNWKGIPDGIAPVEAGEIFAEFEELPTINERADDGSRSPIRENNEIEAGEAYLINADDSVTIEVTSD